jgi:hypothetical protein
MNNFDKALDELKKEKQYHKGAEKLDKIINGSNVYDKDGKTLSPFFIMNNQKLKFIDDLGNIETGKNVLKLNEIYVKTDPNYLPPNEVNKLSFQEQIKRVESKEDKKFNETFWKKWNLYKGDKK